MAVSLAMLTAIFSSFFYLQESTALIPQIDNPLSCGNQQSNHLICELQETKLRIARLESILEESIQELNAKSLYLRKSVNLIEEMNYEIDHLHSVLASIKDDSSHADERLNVLEEEVRLLWAASRRNNFELHTLESKAQDAEKSLEVVTYQVKKMADIITEQWFQIQQLEQAVQIAEMRTLKVKRQVSSTRCTFLKFMKNLFGHHLEKLMRMLDPYLFDKEFALRSYMSHALHQLQRTFSAAKHYHYQLQDLVKQEMTRNEFTAALANNEEVVFFVASSLITFPIISAWMFLSSQFG